MPPPLDEILLESGRSFARTGAQGYLSADHRIFFLHAGTALEHLLKWHLVKIHPSLIADSSFDSLLYAAGLGTRAKKSRMLTITIREALKRCGQLLPALANVERDLELLAEVRNSVAHLGQVDASNAATSFVAFLKAVRHLLAEASLPEETFWGDLAAMVTAQLSDVAEEAERVVAQRLAAARLRYTSRFGQLDTLERMVLVSGVEARYRPEKYEEQLVECPACGNRALVGGSLEVEWEPDWDYSDGEAWIAGVYPKVGFFPRSLKCSVCNLELSGDDELRAAGMDNSWELEDVDPEDFEPDRDYEPWE